MLLPCFKFELLLITEERKRSRSAENTRETYSAPLVFMSSTSVDSTTWCWAHTADSLQDMTGSHFLSSYIGSVLRQEEEPQPIPQASLDFQHEGTDGLWTWLLITSRRCVESWAGPWRVYGPSVASWGCDAVLTWVIIVLLSTINSSIHRFLYLWGVCMCQEWLPRYYQGPTLLVRKCHKPLVSGRKVIPWLRAHSRVLQYRQYKCTALLQVVLVLQACCKAHPALVEKNYCLHWCSTKM